MNWKAIDHPQFSHENWNNQGNYNDIGRFMLTNSSKIYIINIFIIQELFWFLCENYAEYLIEIHRLKEVSVQKV